VFVPHAKAGWMKGITTYDVPDYEKFYLGGINSVRGGDRNDLAPKQDGEPVGGESFLQGNFEIKFPLVEEAGVFGILFVDAGSVYRTDFNTDFGNAIVTAGPEIRWLSPIGPIRLAYGYYLTQKSEYKSSGGFEFSMASAF
jgi:outer membrane protein insertion porin family